MGWAGWRAGVGGGRERRPTIPWVDGPTAFHTRSPPRPRRQLLHGPRGVLVHSREPFDQQLPATPRRGGVVGGTLCRFVSTSTRRVDGSLDSAVDRVCRVHGASTVDHLAWSPYTHRYPQRQHHSVTQCHCGSSSGVPTCPNLPRPATTPKLNRTAPSLSAFRLKHLQSPGKSRSEPYQKFICAPASAPPACMEAPREQFSNPLPHSLNLFVRGIQSPRTPVQYIPPVVHTVLPSTTVQQPGHLRLFWGRNPAAVPRGPCKGPPNRPCRITLHGCLGKLLVEKQDSYPCMHAGQWEFPPRLPVM